MIDLDSLKLSTGSHSSPEEGACVMELASYLAVEPWSDSPKCASRVIAQFLRSWNDLLDNDTRQKLKPYAQKVIGTAASDEVENKRSWLAGDWLVRTHLPAWLDLIDLTDDAAAIRALPELTEGNATAALPTIEIVAKKVRAAASGDAEGLDAGNAAWVASGHVAAHAAVFAARNVARYATWEITRYAAYRPTIVALQASAFGLLDRMIAAK